MIKIITISREFGSGGRTIYKYRLDRENTRYKIISEDNQEDGSVIMEIVKEYGNRTAVGNYLD